MSKKFRTDPLTEQGTVDSEFFASYDYKAEQKILIQYLEAEGFFTKTEDFVIEFRNRKWHVFPQNKTKS